MSERKLESGAYADWDGDIALLIEDIGHGYWRVFELEPAYHDNARAERLTPCPPPPDSPLGRAEARIAELEQWLGTAIDRLEDVIRGDDGQAYVEAMKWLPRIKEVHAKEADA